jgi:hypothetical protein
VATARSIYQPEGWSQRNQRQDQMFTDDHGREWFGSVEIKTGHVCGLLEPQFTAPLVPPPKYIERVPKRPYDLHINYNRWIRDERSERRDWEREGRQMMRKMRGKGYDPREEFGEDVLDILGPPPNAIEPIIAAKQGNRWILGLTKKVDERLVEFFEPEQLEPELREEREPDFRDEKIVRAEKQETGNRRIPVRSNKPEPREATRGTGRRKGHPPHQPAPQGKRERYPKGHPRAGQFVPLERASA